MAQVSKRLLRGSRSEGRSRRCFPGLKANAWQVRGALRKTKSQVLDYITKCDLPAGAWTQKVKRNQR